MSETVESRLQDLLRIERERNRQMEEEIEALHIALRASGERREKAERQVSELEQRLAEKGPGRESSAESEDTSDFYLDSFHRTWNREF